MNKGSKDATNALVESFDDHVKAARQIVIAVQKELHRSTLYIDALKLENNDLHEKVDEMRRLCNANSEYAIHLKDRRDELAAMCDKYYGKKIELEKELNEAYEEIANLQKIDKVKDERIEQLERDNHELWKQKQEAIDVYDQRANSPPKKQKK